MLEEMRAEMQRLCSAEANRFTPAFFEEHILQVEWYARRLAGYCGAELTIVLPAALLHDLAAVSDFSTLADHAALGAVQAEAWLLGHGFSVEAAARVRACAALHSAPVAPASGTPEAVCLSHADALAQIARPAYWLFYAFNVRQFDFAAGCAWYRARLESHWSQLAPFAREMIGRDYHLAHAALCAAPAGRL